MPKSFSEWLKEREDRGEVKSLRELLQGEQLEDPNATYISSADAGATERGVDPGLLKREIEGERQGFLKRLLTPLIEEVPSMATATGVGVAAAKVLPGPYKLLALPLLAAPMYAATKGAIRGTPALEQLKEMPSEAALWAGMETLGPIAGLVGKGASAAGRGVGSAALKALTKAVDLPIARPLQKILPRQFHGETLRELFQPVIERAEPKLAGALKRKELIGDLARQATAEMSSKMKALSLEERYYVADFLKSSRFDPGRGSNSREYMKLPLDSKQRITEALHPYAEWERIVDKINPKHQPLRQMELMKQIQERFVKQLGEEGSVLDATYLDELLPFIRGKTTVEEARGAFREVMAHPALSDESKLLAKDLYTLHHTVADTLPTAVQHAEKNVLFTKLRSNPQWVSPRERAGLVKSTSPSFKGLWVTKDVDQAIKEYDYVPAFFTRSFNTYFMTPWKMAKVVLRVPAHFRNIMSNVILNDVGGLPWYRADIYKRALGEIRSQSQGVKEFARLSGVGTTFAEVETAPLLRQMEKHSDLLRASEGYLSQLAGGLEKGSVEGMKAFNRAYQLEETWAKYSKYLHNVSQGMNKKAAAEDAVRWTFNYGQVTPFTKTLRETVAPFATWTTKVIPLMAEATAKNPLRVAKWALAPYFLTQLSLKQHGMSEKEWRRLRDDMPDYLSKGLVGLLPARDSAGRMQLINFTWFMPGVGDIAQMYSGFSSPTNAAQSLTQNPLLSIAGDLRHNKTMSGVPIYYEWEPPELKAQKLLGYIWMQLAPGILSTDVRKLMQTVQGGPEAPTTGQFGANTFGVPIVPLMPEMMRMRQINKQKAALREIGSRMRVESTKARTPEARTNVMKKYEKIMKVVGEDWKREED